MSVNNTKEKHPFFGKKHNEKSIGLMSINSPTAQSVTIIDTKTNERFSFNSNVKASKFLGVSEWTIRKYKRNMKLYAKRYKIIPCAKKKKPEKLNWPSGALKMLRLQVQILSWAKKINRCLDCKFKSYLEHF